MAWTAATMTFFSQQAKVALYSDSSPQVSVYSIPLQVQPQYRKGKARPASQSLTPNHAHFLGGLAQVLQLQLEIDTLLAQLKNLEKHRAINGGLL